MSKVTLLDPEESGLNAEALIMLQALNSRSAEGIDEKLQRVYAGDPKAFADKYIIGYNHKSVGQGASTTHFIEDVSILAAKAIQDTRYYKGIEASTRYIDLSALGYHLPDSLVEYEQIIKDWLELFNSVNLIMREHFMGTITRPADTSEAKWENAINAAAFDVARGWIPCAQKTLLSWHTDICSIGEHTQYLRTSRLAEVAALGSTLYDATVAKYPTAVPPLSEAREIYLCNHAQAFVIPVFTHEEAVQDATFTSHREFDLIAKAAVTERPYQTYPAVHLNYDYRVRVETTMDYGSWRDWQRHRPLMTTPPVVSADNGFSDWYLNQLPDTPVARVVIARTHELMVDVCNVDATVDDRQYLAPLGTNVHYALDGGLADMIYAVELRSGSAVHPTARAIALDIGKQIEDEFDVSLYLDKSEHTVFLERGGDTITEK